MLIIGTGLIVFASLFYAFVLMVQAKSHIDTSPKRDMVICPKHGAFHAEAAIDINTPGLELETTTGEKTRDKFPYCPRCFEDRIREAKGRYADKA